MLIFWSIFVIIAVGIIGYVIGWCFDTIINKLKKIEKKLGIDDEAQN